MTKESNRREPITAEDVRDNTALMIALASTEPDREQAVEQLGGLVMSLNAREEWLQSMLDAIRLAKKRAVRALNDARINNTSISLRNG